ncbi:hypothetical protein CFC21_056304 [Triticum aestivum]|uniref:Leucine-rich repeat-containing N-terminal plant-type domain-containing protein n=2 Tax=Triticum aestivum TaxID=4565 RepID=A0A3B6INC8_WHEAT|nr:hypothetical protein CFC21_056304 [Triticum aestivum]
MQTIATSLGADRALGWRNDSSPCTDGWTGVACNERGRVTAIRARNASLNGTLPRDMALPWLKELDLRDNAITGQLPSTVFLRLERLRLDNNNFTSVAVGFLAAAKLLQVFTISNNSQLQGWDLPNNPHTIGNLRDYIANNASITGTLSRFLGSSNTFAALDSLSLANNRLTGEVPTTFSSRTLTHLDLSDNFLSGPLDFIAKLPELEELRLDRNSFTGPLPDFSGLWSLQVVTLAHNNLNGVVPATLVRLRGLASVTLRDNLFQGPVPVFAESVQTDVAEASLDGSFCRPQPRSCDNRVESFISIAGALHYPQILAMSWKGNHPCDGWLGIHCDKSGSITGVNLCRLGLIGTIPPAFGDFKSLVVLLLAGNNITGVVPRSIAGLQSLKVLDVSDNSLEGTMPRFQSTTMIWAEGNPNLAVSGTSQTCISGFVVAAMTVIVVLFV